MKAKKSGVVMLQNLILKSAFWITVGVILYVAYLYGIQGPTGSPFSDLNDGITAAWKGFRNVFFLLWLFDLPLLVLSAFELDSRKDTNGILKSVFGYFGMLCLVTFSYALSGLILDIYWTIWAIGSGLGATS